MEGNFRPSFFTTTHAAANLCGLDNKCVVNMCTIVGSGTAVNIFSLVRCTAVNIISVSVVRCTAVNIISVVRCDCIAFLMCHT